MSRNHLYPKVLSVAMSIVLVASLVPCTASAGETGGALSTASYFGVQGEAIAAGDWGTCAWEISTEGTLTVHPGTGGDRKDQTASPWNAYSSSIKKVVFAQEGNRKVVAPAFSRCLFRNLPNVRAIDLSGFDTSNAEDMALMFGGCKSLESLDLSGLDTSNATNLSGLLSGCSSLVSVNLRGFKTSSAVAMGDMFSGCSQLTSVDLSGFDTSKVGFMESMFYRCESLSTLDLSAFDTSRTATMANMFSGCSSLATLDVSGFDTSHVSDMASMFSGCSSLGSIDVSTWNTSNVTNMRSMFQNCSRFSELDVSSLDTSNVMYLNMMFSRCSSLTTLDLSRFKTSSAIDMYGMFFNCESLTTLDLSGFDTSRVSEMGSMFSGCSSLVSVNLSGFDTSHAQGMGDMFSGCTALMALDLSSFDMTGAVMSSSVMTLRMFDGCAALRSLTFGRGFSNASRYDTGLPDVPNDASYRGCWIRASDGVTATSTQLMNRSGSAAAGAWTWLEVEPDPTEAATATLYSNGDLVLQHGTSSEAARGSSIATWTGFEEEGGADQPPWSENARSVKKIVIKDKFAPVSMRSWFEGMSNLTAIEGMAHFDTSSTTDMSNLFSDCSKLTSLNLSLLDTSSVTDMSGMFRACRKLASIDISGFDTSHVESFDSMFWACNALSTINVSGFDTSKATSMAAMFAFCTSVGTLNVTGFNTAKVTDMSSMFEGCSSITTLDVSHFRTTAAVDVSSMFRGCKLCRTLDVSRFDTSHTESMQSMFRDCESLTELDLSGFNTTSLKAAGNGADGASVPCGTDYLLENCTALASITFGAAFSADDGHGAYGPWLPAAPARSPYTGQWVRSSDGATASSADLLTRSGAGLAGTWSWQRSEADPAPSPISIDGATVTLAQDSFTYDGTAKHPAVTSVELPGGGIVPQGQYSVAYSSDCTNAGNYTVTVSASGAYTGSASASFTVAKASLSNAKVLLAQNSYVYDGSDKRPAVLSVTLSSGFAVPAAGYTVGYASTPVEPGTYAVTATGTGNYEGSATAFYTIVAAGKVDITDATVVLEWNTAVYNSAEQRPAVVSVALPDGTAVPQESYDVKYPDECTDAGSYAVVVTGVGAYAGRSSAVFAIAKRTLTADMVSDIANQAFTGKAVEPAVSVSYAGKALSAASDYAVSYEDNLAVGTARVVLTAREESRNFTGSTSKAFNIVRDAGKYKAARDAWRFPNGSYRIPLSVYEDFYGSSYGYKIYTSCQGTGGVCYGMSAAAFASSVYDYPAVSSWTGNGRTATSLYDVGKDWTSADTSSWTKSGGNLTALDYIEHAFIAQKDPKMIKQLNEHLKTPSSGNMAELSQLSQAVNSVVTGIGEIPVLCIFSGTGYGHAITPLRMGRSIAADGNAPARDEVVVYDCNHPGVERSLWLYKDSSGAYSGWDYNLGWVTWGTTQNSQAKISWEYPSGELKSMFARKGEFDLASYQNSLWKSSLYSSNTAVTVVSDGAEYDLSPDGADGERVMYVPEIGFSPYGEAESDDLYWTNLPDEVEFTNIEEDAQIGVASDKGGVSLSVEAGSEAAVKVADDSANKVDIEQEDGAEFEVEYFDEAGDEIESLAISGTGKEHVSTYQSGSAVCISGVTSLNAANGSGEVQALGLDASFTYTVSSAGIDGGLTVSQNKAMKPSVSNFTYDGTRKTGVSAPLGTGYKLSGTTTATNAGTYRAWATLDEGWKWEDGSDGACELVWKISPASVGKASVSLSNTSYSYTGKARMPSATVRLGSSALKAGSDYVLSYKNNVHAGKAMVIVTGKGNYNDATAASFSIRKAANPMKVAGKSLSRKQPKKKAVSIKASAAYRFSKKAVGKVTYARVAKGSSKWLSKVNKKTGAITVKKGAPKKVHKIKVRVSAVGDTDRRSSTKTVTVKVRVR